MQYWGITDRGVVRSQNQDAYAIQTLHDGRVLAVVCDGMGGARAGNVASSMTIELFCAGVSSASGDDEHRMGQAAIHANDEVFKRAITDVDCTGMGTTLVALLLQGKKATIVNVGDSRAYMIDKDGIKQVTTDHSLVQMMISRGELTPEQAKRYPGKNLITRAIGTESQVVCDIFHRRVEKGNSILLCTDGLSNLMDDQEILFEVAHGQDKEHCCERLLDIAKKRGAPDNVTSVLVVV